MSLSLGIHTAGPFCGVALLEGDTLLACREEKMRRGHDQFLPGLVQSVLDEAGIAMGAIDRFSALWQRLVRFEVGWSWPVYSVHLR